MSDDEAMNNVPSLMQENFTALQVEVVNHDIVLLEARMTRVMAEVNYHKPRNRAKDIKNDNQSDYCLLRFIQNKIGSLLGQRFGTRPKTEMSTKFDDDDTEKIVRSNTI